MPNAILTRAIDALASRRDLGADETAEVLAEIMHGEVSETQIAGFLIALRTKGETVQEVTGLARTMRALAAHVPTTREELLDPAGAPRQLIGVSDPGHMEVIAGALASLGTERALVVAGEDGLDEISIAAATKVLEVNGAEITSYQLLAQEVGVSGCEDSDFERD